MASFKDKDYHKLRNPERYQDLATTDKDVYGYVDKSNAEAHSRYKKLWSKYGFKSMVADKRRRNIDRKSNQRDKQTLHQIERARLKQSFRSHLSDNDHAIEAKYGKGYIYTN